MIPHRPYWSSHSGAADETVGIVVWQDSAAARHVSLEKDVPSSGRVVARLCLGGSGGADTTLGEALGPEALRLGPLRFDPTFEAEEDDCFCGFPIQHGELWDMYDRSKRSFWIPSEIDFTQDLKDFEALTPRERHYIELVLAFFASADNLIMKNLDDNYLKEVKVFEIRQFYSFQGGIEAIHAETYNISIDTLVKDPRRKRELFRAVKSVPSIRSKADWVKQWIGSSHRPFAERLVAFACVEGIFFSSSFCALFWLKKRGLMPGLTLSNEFISRDEGLHTEFACTLYREIGRPVAPALVRGIVAEAVALEDRFVDEALPDALLGMNAESMKAYVRFVADWLLGALGCDKMYGDGNPFPFMEMISLDGKTNFFEKRVSDYSKMQAEAQRVLTFEEDF